MENKTVITAFLKLWIFMTMTILSGCSTARTVEDVDLTIAEIKSGIVSYFRGKTSTKTSENRVIVTEPFRPRFLGGRTESLRDDDQVRAYAEITIIGNEKPYTLKLIVFAQEMTKGGTWSDEGEDDRLAKELSQALSEYLQKNRNKNFIDHFRAF